MLIRTFVRAVLLSLLLTGAAATSAADRSAMLVSPGWLAEHLGDPDLVLLHVGTPENYAQHIPGARLVRTPDFALSSPGSTVELPPPDDLRVRLESIGVSDDSRVVVTYAPDAVPVATRFLFTLHAAGLGARASLLDGGTAGWVRAGNAVTAELPAPRTGRLSPLKMQDEIVDAGAVRARAGNAGYAVIDARLPAFYDGTQVGGPKDKPHAAGHIPGARSLPYTEMLDAQQNVKPADALAAVFADAGIRPGDKLTVYCHIGQQATTVIFAARTLGYDAVLYDGSFEDWSKRGFPAETK